MYTNLDLNSLKNMTAWYFSIILLIPSNFLLISEACSPNDNCVPIRECQSIFRLITGNRVSKELATFLRNKQCGFAGNQPLICCAMDYQMNNDRNHLTNTVSLLPSLDKCGASSKDRIVGGKNTEIDEFPWLAMIFYTDVTSDRSKMTFGCGGSLINDRYVLTAAHCVEDNEIIPHIYKPTSVRLGEWDVSTDEDCVTDGYDRDCVTEPVQNIKIESTIFHELWDNEKKHNDIALVRLSWPAQFNYYVKPICLPITLELMNLNLQQTKLSVAGWGVTDKGRQSNIKQKLKIPVVDLSVCKRKYEHLGRIPTNNHLCAGGEMGRDSCKGDSGGPLMKEYFDGGKQFWYLAGLVSYGPRECGSEGVPGVYTKVSGYMDWIREQIKP